MSKPSDKTSAKQNAWTKPLKQKQAASGAPPPGLGPARPPAADEVALRERFLHLMLTMVGQKVSVALKTDGGVELEGILHTATPFANITQEQRGKYALKAPVVISGTPAKEIDPNTTIMISMEDVVQIHCKSIKLTQNGNSFTDTEISEGGAKDRKGLQQAGADWTSPPEARSSTSTRGDIKGSIGGWDQFKANEELFNVKATYDENLYTTELDKSAINDADARKAEKIAKEIEKSTSSNMHIAEERNHVIQGDFDEEDRYSGVLKSASAGSSKKAPVMNYAAAAGKKSEKGSKTAETNAEGVAKKVSPEDKPKTESADTKEKKTEQESTKDKEEPKVEEKESKAKSKLSATAKEFSFNINAKSFTPVTTAQPAPLVHAPVPMQPHPGQFMAPHHMQPGMMPMMNPAYARYPYPGADAPPFPPGAVPGPPSTAGSASAQASETQSNDADVKPTAAPEDANAESDGAAEGEAHHPQAQQPPPQAYQGMPPPQVPGMPPPQMYPMHPGAFMHPGVQHAMYRPGYPPVMVRPPPPYGAGGYGGPPPQQGGYYYEDDGSGNYGRNSNGGRGGRGRGRHNNNGRGRGGRNSGRGNGRGGRHGHDQNSHQGGSQQPERTAGGAPQDSKN